MRFYFLISLFLYSINFLFSQSNWTSTGLNFSNYNYGFRALCNDTSNDLLYAGGNLIIGNDAQKNILLKYNGSYWDTVPVFFNNTITSIVNFHNCLYVGGYFDKVDSLIVNGIAKWDGSQWSNVGDGFHINPSEAGVVFNLKIINDSLYAMGIFNYSNDSSTHLNSLSKYDGNNWTPFHDLPNLWNPSDYNQINDIVFYKNNWYVGGNFQNDTLSDIVKYNGNYWEKLEYGIYGGISSVQSMVVYENELIVGGLIYKNAGNVGNFIQSWNGSQWKEIGESVSGININSNAQVHDLVVKNNLLYVSGVFCYASGVPASSIAIWDNSKWCGLGGVFDNRIVNMEFYHDSLYVACGLKINLDTVNWIAKWIGGSYFDTCSQTYSISEINYNNDFIIYPNPATTNFTISTSNTQSYNTKIVNIYSIEGVLVKKENYTEDEIRIDTSEFPSGIFIVELKTKEGSWYKKVVVTK